MPEKSSSPRHGLRFAVALPCEASPIIGKYRLEPATGDYPFRIYHDRDLLRWLIVTGVGRHSAAMATAYLAGMSAASRAVAWLNVGVAGHATIPLGEARAVHKITDVMLGSVYYPPAIFEGLKTEALVTMSEPEESLAPRMLVDMEASGFYASAITFSSLELVHCLKVVSDHGVKAGERFSKAAVTLHIEKQLAAIEAAADQLLDLSNTLATRWADPPYFDSILAEFHFTATEKHQLRELLQRWQVLVEDDVVAYLGRRAATGHEVITCLTERLKRVLLPAPEP